MKPHPASVALPEMGDDDYQSLKLDIETHGLLCPIELHEGLVLDGRHRFRACQELGIEPVVIDVDLDGMTPAEYVWSLNGARRHLTPSQRAAVAVELLPELKREAKKRQIRKPKSVPELVPEQKGDAAQQAADLVGTNEKYVRDAEKIKAKSPELFSEIKTGTKTVKRAAKELKQRERMEFDKRASRTAKRHIAKTPDADGIYHGDSFQLGKSIPDESCALIFTDPPYDRESLHWFYQLGMLASKILVDGGSLITFCGHYCLREVIDLVAVEDDDINRSETEWFTNDDEPEPIDNDMHLFWINCCLHTGGTAQMREYGIKVKWKPMLWFVKGKFRRDRETWVDDLVESQQEKDHHLWQQSVSEASYYIERLTVSGELVVDPFCGGATTAVAAKLLNRQWWTADIDATAVRKGRKRINDTNI